MGWDTYFALPGGFPETTILQQADRLKADGLEAKGYKLIWLDAGWWQGQRDAAGNIMVNPTQWPRGIAWLASETLLAEAQCLLRLAGIEGGRGAADDVLGGVLSHAGEIRT